MKLPVSYKQEFRENLKLAFPIMAGQLGQITVNVADNLMVGRLGAAPLAAVSLSVAIFVVFFVVGMGISFALPPLVAAADGSSETRKISRYFKHSLIINLAFAVISLAVIEAGIPLLSHLGQEEEVVVLAIPYLRISTWSLLPLMIFQTFRCYSDGRSETLPPMMALIAGNLLNVLLNYILIFGKFGAPALGVTGAALGTLGSRIFMLFLLIGILFFWKDLWNPIRFANFRSYKKVLFKKILDLGIPTSLQMFFEVSAFAGAALLMGMISKEAQAAHQIAINLAAISFLICTGLAMACTIRVGNKWGQKNLGAVRLAGFSAIVQVVIFMSCVAVLFIVFRHFLPTLYIDEQEVITIAAGLLIMAAIFQIPDGIQVTVLGALRGIQDVKVPSLITFVAYWIFGLPISYFAAFYFGMGPIGVWIGLVFGLSISAFLLTNRFNRKTLKK